MAEPVRNADDWLSAARAGSRDAQGQALEACRAYLLLVAQQELDPDLRAKGGASDLVQETFLDAHNLFDRFHGTTETELLAWLRQLLLNNLADFQRRYRATDKRRVTREIPLAGDNSSTDSGGPPAETPTPSAEAVAHEEAVELQRALDHLPEDYRQILMLRYQEGRSFEEIGTLMGRSANAVRKLWLRAVQRLREEMEGGHGG
jgi:RNA polymerase sigma-70 factor (ECF subfamily)